MFKTAQRRIETQRHAWAGSLLAILAAGAVQAQDQNWSRRFLVPVEFDQRAPGGQPATEHHVMEVRPSTVSAALPVSAPVSETRFSDRLSAFSTDSPADTQALERSVPPQNLSPGAITFAGLIAAPEMHSAAPGQAASYDIGIGWDVALTPQLHLRGSLLSGEDENGQYSLSPEYRQLALTASFRF